MSERTRHKEWATVLCASLVLVVCAQSGSHAPDTDTAPVATEGGTTNLSSRPPPLSVRGYVDREKPNGFDASSIEDMKLDPGAVSFWLPACRLRKLMPREARALAPEWLEPVDLVLGHSYERARSAIDRMSLDITGTHLASSVGLLQAFDSVWASLPPEKASELVAVLAEHRRTGRLPPGFPQDEFEVGLVQLLSERTVALRELQDLIGPAAADDLWRARIVKWCGRVLRDDSSRQSPPDPRLPDAGPTTEIP